MPNIKSILNKMNHMISLQEADNHDLSALLNSSKNNIFPGLESELSKLLKITVRLNTSIVSDDVHLYSDDIKSASGISTEFLLKLTIVLYDYQWNASKNTLTLRLELKYDWKSGNSTTEPLLIAIYEFDTASWVLNHV